MTSSLPGELLRDALIPAKSIPAETRKRLSPYIFENVSTRLVTEYEEKGWVVHRPLKRSVKMRKAKTHDRAFEDKVWAALAKLHFPSLNRDRVFKVAYGQGANESQQVDVFAADDEVVLVVECKSSESLRNYQLKREIEAIQGTREGLIRAIRSEFPDHKVKFILATNNCGVTKATLERIEAAGIVHMDEDVIDYYLDLASHLGKAARYQLLGSLFAGQKIPGLEPRVAAVQAKMGGHTYYSFVIEPARLLKLGYILHRSKANIRFMPTYQRLIKKTRLNKVSNFIQAGGFFPNSIILSVESGPRGLQFDILGKGEGRAKAGILHLPKTYRAAYVIDGQHRLYGYAESEMAETDLVPVVAFMNLRQSEQVALFMQINENQHAVPKNLRNTLNADLLWGSNDLREQMRALKLRIAQDLADIKSSPLHGRIIVGEDKKTAHKCITIDAISRGLERGSLLGSFTRTEVRESGTFYRGSNDATGGPLTEFLELCLWHVREGLETQWGLGGADGGFVFINNGIESTLRVLSDIVEHLADSSDINPRAVDPQEVFDEAVYFLDPLIDHLKNLSSDEGREYRKLYGSGAGTKYWRRLQMAIQDVRGEFCPVGLAEYRASEAKQFNTESFTMVGQIEEFLKADVRQRLQDEFGARWRKDGVPRRIQQDAGALAVKKNVERDPEDEVEAWDCLHLIDYQDILTQNHALWQRLFEKRYTKPGEENKPGGWKTRSTWLVELNRIRNEIAHGGAVDVEDHDFLVTVTTWLVEGQADNDL